MSSQGAVKSALVGICAAALDAALAFFLVLTLFIIATGGGVYQALGTRISARSVGNPLLISHLILLLRMTVLREVPLFRMPALRFERLRRMALSSGERLASMLTTLTARRAKGLLISTIAFVTLAKLANAYFYPGFVSGDDVEVHEMTFASLFDTDWTLWNIRSPLYPFLIIYPIQALLVAAGERDTATLVFAGRCSVAVISSLAVWLTYRLGAITAGRGYGVVAAIVFGMHRLNVTFGGSELPRPVSVVFIAGACLCLQLVPGARRAILAGALLAVGAALRFSELIFIVPAFLDLLSRRRYRDLLVCGATVVVVATVCLGLVDRFFWGETFFSFKNIFHYTVVDRLSSRGYQSPLYYLLSMQEWTALPIVVLAVLGCSADGRRVALWWIVPLFILSMFPHKEPRYVIPLLPFLSVNAALGLRNVLDAVQRLAASGKVARAGTLAMAMFILLGGAALFEVGGWRFRKPAEAVAVARYIHAAGCTGSVAFEQSWTAGGRLYLRECELIDVRHERSGDSDYLRNLAGRAEVEWFVIRTAERHDPRARILLDAGFKVDEGLQTTSHLVARRRPNPPTVPRGARSE